MIFVDRAELLLHDALDRETTADVDRPPSRPVSSLDSGVLSRLYRRPSTPHLPGPPGPRRLAVGRAQRAAAADADRRRPGRRRRRRDRGDGVLPPSASVISAGGHCPLLSLHRLFVVISSFPLSCRRSLHAVLLPISSSRRRRGVSSSAARLRRLLAATADNSLRDDGGHCFAVHYDNCTITLLFYGE